MELKKPFAAPSFKAAEVPVVQVAEPMMEHEEEVFESYERNPSDWSLMESDDDEDEIIATHTDGRVFKGTVKQFSKLLRG